MNESGKNILAATREVRKNFESVRLLLDSASALMVDAGWVSYGTTATADNSAAIYNPGHWMPRDAFRFFKRGDRENIICFVSVIFDDLEDPSAMKEPLASVGWLDLGKGNNTDTDNGWNYSLARIALLLDNQPDDKSLSDIPNRLISEKISTIAQRARVASLPLVSIEDAAGLEQLLIEPLLNDMR